jgi:hypothetical protein
LLNWPTHDLFAHFLQDALQATHRLLPNEDVLKYSVESLLNEIRLKLEKPDRNFFSIGSYISVSDYAKTWFETDLSMPKKHFPRQYYWSDPRSQYLETLNLLWTAGTVGLFLLYTSLKQSERCSL